MAERAKQLYESFEQAATWYNLDSLTHARQVEATVFHKWNSCFNAFEGKKSNSNTAKICEETTTKLSDFNTQLGRRLLCIDDIKSVLTNKHKFRILYTDDDTYLSKDPVFEPEEEGESLFSFE